MDVLVTRPIEAGRRTADKLYARGHRAILAPLLTLHPVAGSAPPGPYDAVAVTSASVALAAERLRPFLDVPVFAVGDQTASTLRALNFASVLSGEGDAAALAGLMIAALPEHARVLYIAGRDRKSDLESALTLAGHKVVTWVVYAAESAVDLSPGVTHRLGTGQIDAVLHYSPRTARIFANLSRKLRLIAGMSLTPHLCLSEDVAEPLRHVGISRIAISPVPDEAAMLDLLERYGDRKLA